MTAGDELVTVCASCLCASCWHGEFYCDDYKTADLVKKTRAELLAAGREHPDHFSPAKLREVYGAMYEPQAAQEVSSD